MTASSNSNASGSDSERPKCPKCSGDVRTISVPVKGESQMRYCCVKCRHKFDAPKASSGA